MNFNNSLTQHAVLIWAWWINKLYVVFQCTKSIDFRDYLKKRRKFASIVFLFALRLKKTVHDENND
jgi:molybdopterin/thiamine biosynthesis adenylyltransferase